MQGANPEPQPSGEGRWPTTRQGFLWDLAPTDIAPGKDGVVPPKDHVHTWLENISQRATTEQLRAIIELERARTNTAKNAAETAEAKASRLLAPVVALLTGAVALIALQLAMAAKATTPAGMTFLFLTALPGVAAVWFLLVAATRALDADTRVGVYKRTVVTSLADLQPQKLAVAEHLAANRAEWNSKQKLTRLMFARAAVSRAVLFVAVALVTFTATTVAGGFASLPQHQPAKKPPATPAATTTVSPGGPARSQPAVPQPTTQGP